MNSMEMLDAQSEIAVIGMACRLPGANDADEFWRNLRDGVESVTFLSEQELRASGVDPALFNEPSYVRATAALEGIEMFDASFFGFTPREAEITDPQHRLFLECAWETLENAGYAAGQYRGRVGIYAGASMNTYLLSNLHGNADIAQGVGFMQTAIGNEKDHLATQISYKLNLKGPGMSISTACSTSLVAIHLACQSLLNGECDMALAGGVSVRVPHKVGYTYVSGGVASPDGHCRAFDADAGGTVPGSGVGIVLLKRLEDALADGDCIHAVIKGSAINNDGSRKIGYTAPSVIGQAEVIAEAQALAGVAPETVSYIEAHGAGTPLGDPIEMAALTKVFQAQTGKKQFCAVGSVKTNIGHLDAAAGVVGFIKTVLALEHKQLPPSLHFEQPNPEIKFENSPFYVSTILSDWQTTDTARRAGVSSFGIGGTNAHVVLEEAPCVAPGDVSRPSQLLVLSAKTESALQAATSRLGAYFSKHPETHLADAAYTLQVGRAELQYRRYFVCNTLHDAINGLDSRVSPIFRVNERSHDRSMIFLLPGLSMLQVDTALELYRNEPTFRQHIDHCAEFFEPHLGFNICTVLYPDEERKEEAAHRLTQFFVAEPALFVIEYALAQLWMEWGVMPDAMIGHNLGEFVAACLAGVLSLYDAVTLVASHGQLLDEIVSGAMRAPLIERFFAVLKKISLNPPKLPYVSSLTGTWITAQDATDPNYWGQHLREPVHLIESVQALSNKIGTIILTIGVETSLIAAVGEQLCTRAEKPLLLQSLADSPGTSSDIMCLLETCGRLWCVGISINWQRFSSHEKRRRIPLPTYPFERERYWINPSPKAERSALPVWREKKVDFAHWFSLPSWKRSIFPSAASQQKSYKTCWLVFIDQAGIGSHIVRRLKLEGQVVVTVRSAKTFSKIADQDYTLDPCNEEDYDKLLADLHTLNQLPEMVIHLWSISSAVCQGSKEEAFRESQELGFYSLLFLAQACGRQNSTHPMQIRVISNGVQDVESGDSDALAPEKSTLLGACKVIPQECSNIICQSIDIVLSAAGSWEEEQLIEHLMSELFAPLLDPVLAYRDGYRWVQIFDPIQLEPLAHSTKLREAGVYLITGGLGEIGLILAKWLAQSVHAKLVLTGRSGLPPKTAWESWLTTHDDSDTTSRRIRKVEELEAIGAEVLVIAADAANRDQMREAVARSLERFGTIHGVFHAAGIIEDEAFLPVHETRRASCEIHFQPKVYGLFVLEEVLQQLHLDFCLLLSSLSSVLGGLGFIGYASANIFMDAYACKINREQRVRWISVDWDGRATAEETVKAFQLILATDTITQIVVATEDLQAKFKLWTNPSLSWETEHVQKDQFAPLHPRPELQESYVAAQSEQEQQIADIWCDILGIDKIGINDNFFELGGTSLMIIQIIRRMQEVFRIVLSMQLIFENPTIASLAQVVVQKQIEAIGAEQMAELMSKLDQMSEEDMLLQLERRG